MIICSIAKIACHPTTPIYHMHHFVLSLATISAFWKGRPLSFNSFSNDLCFLWHCLYSLVSIRELLAIMSVFFLSTWPNHLCTWWLLLMVWMHFLNSSVEIVFSNDSQYLAQALFKESFYFHLYCISCFPNFESQTLKFTYFGTYLSWFPYIP